ncbi:MAG: hypothetical protein R3C03_04365 [Pirellulaceae bacterium]
MRAALTFWDEEMGAVDQSVYKHYLHSTDLSTKLTAQDVAETRDYFNNVDLKVALLDKQSGKFDSESPIDPTHELSYQSGHHLPVAVLVSRPR